MPKKMLFFRGISVPAKIMADVKTTILEHGLLPGKGRWTIQAHYLKPRLQEIWQRPIVTYAETRSGVSPQWVCACAEPAGATYYACQHNRTSENDAPLLITFKADLADVIIDGRDFLYTVFQFGEPEKARPVAELLFGQGIKKYLDRAWSTQDQSQRVAICDLAVQDDRVVRAHAKNVTMIGGR
jgi:hypothetical protein